MHVVSRAMQQLADVRDNVSVGIDTKHASSRRRRLLDRDRRAIKGGDGVLFRIMAVEQLGQMREVQNFADMLGNLTKLQVTAYLAGAGQCPHQGSEAAAVDECQPAKVKDDEPAVAKNPGDLGAKGFHFGAGNQASAATYDGYPTYIARLQGKLHPDPPAGTRTNLAFVAMVGEITRVPPHCQENLKDEREAPL